jgi:hypothetical protein
VRRLIATSTLGVVVAILRPPAILSAQEILFLTVRSSRFTWAQSQQVGQRGSDGMV